MEFNKMKMSLKSEERLVWAGFAVAVVVVICISFGIWVFVRNLNYQLSYKSMVEKTVKELVKPECLKNDH